MSTVWKSFKNKPRPLMFWDYYQLEFLRLHGELEQSGYRFGRAPAESARFWDDIPDGRYPPERGIELVAAFTRRLEQQLAELLARHSIAYWLHAYRRIAPRLPGASPATVWIVRRTLEAAFQKYGRRTMCDRIASSADVPLGSILNGALLDERLRKLTDEAFKAPQLVLTNFGLPELAELYDAESLAYQIWGCGATRRVLGKGARLLVDVSLPHRFRDDRSDELHRLVTSFDSREQGFVASATGTVFASELRSAGLVMVPVYNVSNQHDDYVRRAFEVFSELKLASDSSINFAWLAFDMRQFFHAHQPFAAAFLAKHGVALTSVLALAAGLLFAAAASWRMEKGSIVRLWQRAYDGPFSTRARIERVASEVMPLGVQVLGPPADMSDMDISKAVNFWTSKPAAIDVPLGGPMGLFLPSGQNCIFIDYAWLQASLYFLFFDVRPQDERFKGRLLEERVHAGRSVLPDDPCRMPDGQQREVDAALAVGTTLILAECRAFGRSFGFERGDPAAVAFRNEKINKALTDADEKARLLAAAPVGRNYDISRFERIVPIGVTPFVEFVPSVAPHYWLTETIPRVLTPGELDDAIVTGVFARPLPSSISVSKA